jgi:flagellar basal-body rod modification protein FlgD
VLLLTTNQINFYGTSSDAAAPKTEKTAKSTLGSEDFLKLLAAQMSNQDVMNPTNNTEYISQLAQFSSLKAMTELSQTGTSQLEAMDTLAQISYTQYGASLVGKNVVVASYDDSGKLVKDTGVVTNANFTDGICVLTVNQKTYKLSSVMEVTSEPQKTTDSGAAPKAVSNTTTDSASGVKSEKLYSIGVPENAQQTDAAKKG